MPRPECDERLAALGAQAPVTKSGCPPNPEKARPRMCAAFACAYRSTCSAVLTETMPGLRAMRAGLFAVSVRSMRIRRVVVDPGVQLGAAEDERGADRGLRRSRASHCSRLITPSLIISDQIRRPLTRAQGVQSPRPARRRCRPGALRHREPIAATRLPMSQDAASGATCAGDERLVDLDHQVDVLEPKHPVAEGVRHPWVDRRR